MPQSARSDGATSRWPAVLRWLDVFSLDALEKVVLRSPRLQRFVLRCHERAFRRLLPPLPTSPRIAIVGGGLFPRTLLVLQRLVPDGCFVVIDWNANNIATARTMLPDREPPPTKDTLSFPRGAWERTLATLCVASGSLQERDAERPELRSHAERGNEEMARALLPPEVQFWNECYDPARVSDFDVVVFPLAFVGDRAAIYRHPPAPCVLVHDWLWRRRGTSTIISLCLCKRLNRVRP